MFVTIKIPLYLFVCLNTVFHLIEFSIKIFILWLLFAVFCLFFFFQRMSVMAGFLLYYSGISLFSFLQGKIILCNMVGVIMIMVSSMVTLYLLIMRSPVRFSALPLDFSLWEIIPLYVKTGCFRVFFPPCSVLFCLRRKSMHSTDHRSGRSSICIYGPYLVQ